MSSRNRRKQSKPAVRGPDAHARAFEMLARGETIINVANTLGVGRETIRTWRDSPDGQAYLQKVRRDREQAYTDAAEDAKRSLREGLWKATNVLIDMLDSDMPNERMRAALEVLDRSGVLRGEQLHVTGGVDLSKLSDEELANLDALRKKTT